MILKLIQNKTVIETDSYVAWYESVFQAILIEKHFEKYLPETCGYLPFSTGNPENPFSNAEIKYFPLISMMSAVFPNGRIPYISSRVIDSRFQNKTLAITVGIYRDAFTDNILHIM